MSKMKRVKRLVGRLEKRDGQEFIRVGDLSIPVLGVVNCTGKPLPEARETAKRIEAFLSKGEACGRDEA